MPTPTPLTECQRAAGGKIIDFGGWDLPVQFQGIVAEHQAVRNGVGIFDVSHMGRLRVTGAGALAYLEKRVTRALGDMVPGQTRYGLALADDGTVEDDLLVGRVSASEFQVVCNASNRAKLIGLWGSAPDATLTDQSAELAMMAVQGPQAGPLLARLGLGVDGLANYRFRDASWQGAPVRVSRTGYTGEDGAELLLPADRAVALWRTIVDAGATPCGLGARDTLRLEAAMPLYGHELDRSITPIEAGLAFAVRKTGGFIGAERILRELAQGPARRLIGLRMREKRVPRQGYAVLHDGKAVGQVTSGTLSPTLGQAIGMAYVPAALATAGTALAVDLRGTVLEADVVPLPFYKRPRG